MVEGGGEDLPLGVGPPLTAMRDRARFQVRVAAARTPSKFQPGCSVRRLVDASATLVNDSPTFIVTVVGPCADGNVA